MKYVLFILLTACAFNLKAQAVTASGQQKADSFFSFNKRYYEMEDHWVVYPPHGNKYDKANFNKYRFGFVYFDELLGYAITQMGQFGIDGLGHVFREPTDYFKNESYKDPLLQISYMVSAIPDNILTQLKVKPILDWVIAYHKEHPDTKTVAMKLHVGKLSIFARDAAQYIGKQAEVYYNHSGCYKTEVKNIKANSVLVLYYIGVADKSAEIFIDIIEVDTKQDDQAKWLKTIEVANHSPIKRTGNASQQKDRDYYDSMAQGKIILFEGKPAIVTKFDDRVILEPID